MNIFVLKAWLVATLSNDEQGASMVEYAFLVSLIAVVCIVAVGTIGSKLDTKYTDVGTSLS